jgi:hypothetical protein
MKQEPKQTAVEWLELNLLGLISFDSEELRAKYKDRVAKAKEMEKQQQGYSLEDLECAWNSSDQNMRFQFSSSAYKAITFKQWLEKYEHER